MTGRETVALALGGGGARGYAHIGVIEVLEERGYEIVAIAGTSMGALVGGLHGARALDRYAAWVRTLTQRDVVRLLDPTVRGAGAFRGDKVFAKVGELLGDRRIEDLAIPFTAVATDLLTGREIWFRHGPVVTAARASIAIPSFITPIAVGDLLLADGGLLNPVPVSAITPSNADLTIAVCLAQEHLAGHAPVRIGREDRDADVGAHAATDDDRASAQVATELHDVGDADPAQSSAGFDLSRMLDSDIARTIIGWLHTDRDDLDRPGRAAPPDSSSSEPSQSDLRTLQIMQLSLDALQGSITRFQLAAHPPDLTIGISRTACRSFEFHRAGEMIELGRQRAHEALAEHESAR